MSDFSINTNFKALNFDNKVAGFDNNFNVDIANTKDASKANLKFDEIFNSINKEAIPAGISINTGEDKKISSAEKTVNDIGKGLAQSLNDLNSIQNKYEKDFEKFASGGDISVHDVMISAQKSNLSMQMAIQLRNRIIAAYNEFKSMSV